MLGFLRLRNAVRTREALFEVQMLFQHYRHTNGDINACFNYSKACYSVQHQKLTEILKSIEFDKEELNIIINPHWNW